MTYGKDEIYELRKDLIFEAKQARVAYAKNGDKRAKKINELLIDAEAVIGELVLDKLIAPFNNIKVKTAEEEEHEVAVMVERQLRLQFVKYDRENDINIMALMLWQLHTQLGFGKARLRKFYDNFKPAFEQMISDYDVKEEHRIWICDQLIKDLDIWLEEWYDEGKVEVEKDE